MNLAKISLKRPVSVFMVILAIVIFGVKSIFSAPLELLPEMELPMMIVYTIYPGAGPEEVEKQVTSIVEMAVGTVQGVEDIISSSSENTSFVQLSFSYGTNMDNARSDVQKNLDTYNGFFPEDAIDPVVIEISMDMQDTITLAIQQTGDMDLLSYVNDVITPEFEKLSGVASVTITGGKSKYINVEIIEEEMTRYGMDASFLASQMSTANFSMPVGSIEKGSAELILRGESEYSSAAELSTMPIMTPMGGILSLSDVANVYDMDESADSISRFNGNETITMGIAKRSSASTLDVCKAVSAKAYEITNNNMGVRIDVISDTSEQIIAAITTLGQTLVIGIGLSMFVLLIFFGEWRASVIVGVSMPVSVLATLMLMDSMGFTYNLISLGGLVIAVGMIVDNSIVVLESCFRYQKDKLPPMEAALKGAEVVTASIIASTITTIVVFLPMAIMDGLSGEMFAELGYTIIFALVCSLISALTMVPLIFILLKPKEKDGLLLTRILDKVGESYGKFLLISFKVKWLVVFVAIGLLWWSFAILSELNTELIPAIDQGTITIKTENRAGLQLDKVDEIARSIEDVVSVHPDVARYSVNGSGDGITFDIYLTSDRVMETEEVVTMWQQDFKDTIDYTVSVSSYNMATMMAGSSTIDVIVQSNNQVELAIAADQVLEVMNGHSGIVTASSSLSNGSPQATIIVDPVKAAGVGAMPIQIISTISNAMQGVRATSVSVSGTDYDVYINYPEDRYKTITDLEGLNYISSSGRIVPVMDLITIEYSNAPETISKTNSQYQATISGQPIVATQSKTTNEIMELVADLQFPDSVSITAGAAVESMEAEFASLLEAILSAVFLVFMVMAMQFESVRFSIIVMMCIPFCLIGAFGLLYITGVSLSMVSLMGMLMLVGIVINNGILFIDTANQLRSSMDAPTALVYAGKMRMRPILMTTTTTVLSMVPMALGIGEGSEIMQGMAMIIIGGMLASTVLTLILLPSFYLIVRKRTKEEKAEKKAKRHGGKTVPVNTQQKQTLTEHDVLDVAHHDEVPHLEGEPPHIGDDSSSDK